MTRRSATDLRAFAHIERAMRRPDQTAVAAATPVAALIARIEAALAERADGPGGSAPDRLVSGSQLFGGVSAADA